MRAQVPGPNDVKIKAMVAGIHLEDYTTALELNTNGNPIKRISHIPREEMTGQVSEIGDHAKGLCLDDKVIVYHRIFDDTNDVCMKGY